jgi:hypothetical protein
MTSALRNQQYMIKAHKYSWLYAHQHYSLLVHPLLPLLVMVVTQPRLKTTTTSDTSTTLGTTTRTTSWLVVLALHQLAKTC